MSQTQKKNQKVPTFSELAGNVNKLKREVTSLEQLVKQERNANVNLLVSLSSCSKRNYKLTSNLVVSFALNIALVGAIILILGANYV